MARSKSSRKSKKRTPAPPTWDERLVDTLLPWRAELGGLLLFLFALITLLALPGWTKAGWWWTNLLKQIVGWGAYPLFLTLAGAGVHLMLRRVERPYQITTAQLVGLEMILITALPLSHLLSGAALPDAYAGRGGGLVGWALSAPLLDFFGPILTVSLYLALLAWGGGLITQKGWSDVQQWLRGFSLELQEWGEAIAPAPRPDPPPEPEPASNPSPPPPPDELIIIDNAAPQAQSRPAPRPRQLPPISLLQEGGTVALTKEEIDEKIDTIEQTLADFGLPAQVTQVRRGPAVTQFGVTPGYIERTNAEGETVQKKVRVGQIRSLRRDLALALAVPRLRVEAPVPGQGVVGVEVPNAETAVVRLRSIIESLPFQRIDSPLAVGLGRDVSGTAVAVDLARMPHLLIAGTTGSGKSVCINALIACLVFNNPPERLKLIMIDPKRVELIRFNGLPHLIGTVETEADRAVGVLRWLTAEMDRRYETFETAGARNLDSYNRKMRQNGKMELPYLAVFIDELADLMHIYPGDVERTLCRLAQMARATGIHLVVATQRPSTDVITGLIKANFPARLSFAVASNTDSRVILDVVGAEHLMGRGDMLFLGPEASAPRRVQGVLMGEGEIEAIVRHWRGQYPDFTPEDPPWQTLIAKFALLDETDSLLEEAIELTQKRDAISTSYLQRRLRIGFPRAARLMEHLYELGLVDDPKSGGKTRKTQVDEDDDPLQEILSDR